MAGIRSAWNTLVRAWDNVTGAAQAIFATGNALHIVRADVGIGEDEANDVIKVESQFGYEVVPVTTQTTLGATGAAGDLLHKVLAGNATTAIAIHDGATLVYTWTITAATEPNELTLNLVAQTAWKLTCTGAGATAIGRFT